MSTVLWLNAADDTDSPGDTPAETGEPVYDAEDLRRASTAWWWPSDGGPPMSARGGVRPDHAGCVTLSGGRAEVAEFTAVVWTAAAATDGPYVVAMDAHAHALPAPADLPRRDILVLRILDDDVDGGRKREPVTEYITGEAAAEPKPPAVPEGTVRIASIDVPTDGAASVSLPASVTVTAGGILPVTSAGGLPSKAPYPGAAAWARNPGTLYIGDEDLTWVPVVHADPVASHYVPELVVAAADEFTALAGGPKVTVTIGPSGKARVDWGARIGILSDADTRSAKVRVVMSGANTGVVGSNYKLESRNAPPRSKSESWPQTRSAFHILTGLKQGKTTFTVEYTISTDKCEFTERELAVTLL